MNYKSLLMSAAMVVAGASAFAFPANLSVSPTPGQTFTEKAMFDSFQISPSGSYSVDASKTPLLVNDLEGEEIEATGFKDFMGMAIIINFDSNDIIVNGDWQLQIPAGAITVNGEANPTMLTYDYVLNDPTLNTGAFPQITLTSITPAPDTRLANWGGSNLERVNIKTSDDAAVNLINWYLYDVTNGEGEFEREYVRQGSENRIDFNRNEHKNDVWTNGLYFTVGGEPDKMIEGHKYRLDLEFYGIGYDPETNQYATPQQQAQSLELKTSVYYYGLTPAPEYSPYTFVSISPEPDNYEIEEPEQGIFVITYTGPVRPHAFTYPLGSGAGTANAGTYSPIGENITTVDGIQYADMWEFTISPSILDNVTGTISTNVSAKDQNGLWVKGSGDFLFDNNLLTFTWSCNTGAPEIISVEPIENATVKSLSKITVTNQPKDGTGTQVMSVYDNSIVGPAEIRTLDGAVVRTLEHPTLSANETSATWSFEPITTAGTYVLMIPKYYFNIGEEMSATFNNGTSFRYYVESEQPGNAVYDLVPASVTPADGTTVSEIKSVVVTFPNTTLCSLDPLPKASLYYNEALVAEVSSNEGDDYWNPKTYTFTFASAFTEQGAYKLVIPQGAFYDETYDMEGGKAGRACPELVYNYTIGNNSGVDSIIAEGVEYNVFNLQGVKILNRADADAVKALPAGLYIVNGQKVVVK
ncbi:MAG: hypothetical protein NC328_07415 [Muribaculum sp.]|nr:hypothetical protein [Muribaculum sp.]